MKPLLLILALALTAACALPSDAHAQDGRAAIEAPSGCEPVRLERSPCCPEVCPPKCLPYDVPCGTCCWQWELSIAAWFPASDGRMNVRGREVDVDSSISEGIESFIDHGESFFQGRIKGWYGKWGFRLAGQFVTYADGVSFREGGAGIDAEASLNMWQADVSYCISKCPLEPDCNGCTGSIAYEVFAGIRYFDIEGEIDPARLPGVQRSRDFVDPIIGARVTYDLGNRWMFDLEGDIGGFGIGSDFSWSLRASARYRFTDWFSLEGGWKALDIDYADGSGANRFEWDVLFHGPYLAFNFNF